MAEIRISWTANPQGQLGPRPQPIKLNERCRVTSPDIGDLSVEFKGDTPLTNGNRIRRDVEFVALKPGRFPFQCIVTLPGRPPMTIEGGEIEIGTEG